MPIRHGTMLASRASTWLRDHFWRNTMAARSSRRTMWSEFLPISMPITATAVCAAHAWRAPCLGAPDQLIAGGAGARPDRPISRQKNRPIQALVSIGAQRSQGRQRNVEFVGEFGGLISHASFTVKLICKAGDEARPQAAPRRLLHRWAAMRRDSSLSNGSIGAPELQQSLAEVGVLHNRKHPRRVGDQMPGQAGKQTTRRAVLHIDPSGWDVLSHGARPFAMIAQQSRCSVSRSIASGDPAMHQTSE